MKGQSMDGNMRRLPPWMLAAASSGVTDSSNRSENKSIEVERKHEPEAPKTKAEKRLRRTVKPKERDEPKNVGIKKRGEKRIRSKIGQEAKRNSNGNKPEITQTTTNTEDENLTVDDLLSFAQEYVESEDQSKDHESMVVMGESNMRSSQGVTQDPSRNDMLDLLLGPFFKKPQ